MQVFRIETVVVTAFCHTIIFIKPCGVASSAEIMGAIGLFKRKNPAASWTLEIFVAKWFAIS